MLDVSVSYNRYKFLGHEFLTWLWFLIEEAPDSIRKLDPKFESLRLGNRIVLENQRNESKETLTIKGDDAGLEEGILALKKGAFVTEMNLFYKTGEHEWQFTIKGESIHITNLKCPATGVVEVGEDIEGAVLEKTYLVAQVVVLIESIYKAFIKLRISAEWEREVVLQVKKWISS